jgi:hypothetical protein
MTTRGGRDDTRTLGVVAAHWGRRSVAGGGGAAWLEEERVRKLGLRDEDLTCTQTLKIKQRKTSYRR